MWRLGVLDVGLDHADVIGNMAVRRKNIKHSIKIVIEEKDRKRQRLRRHFSNPRLGCLVGEDTATIIGIKGHAFVSEIPNGDALASGSVIIARIDTHPGARGASLAKSY